jgi:hypothetical protein
MPAVMHFALETTAGDAACRVTSLRAILRRSVNQDLFWPSTVVVNLPATSQQSLVQRGPTGTLLPQSRTISAQSLVLVAGIARSDDLVREWEPAHS